MFENTRTEFLEAMGITPLYPRALVPQAKKSPEYRFDPQYEELDSRQSENTSGGEAQEPQSANAQFKRSTPSPSADGENGLSGALRSSASNTALQGLREALQAKPAAKEKFVSALGPEKAEHPRASESMENNADIGHGEQLQFSLRYYRIDDNTVVLSEEPFGLVADPTRLALERQAWEALLVNILAAISISADAAGMANKSEVFQWPLPNMPAPEADGAGIDGESIARNALLGYLSQKLQQRSSLRVIAFAGRTAPLLRQLEQPLLAHIGRSESSNSTWLVTESLASMISVPLLKRGVWEKLKNAF